MRALLIVNPHATSTTRGRRDVIVRALASAVDLEVVQTRYRGEATNLAAAAASDKFGLVMALGGDGTVNEAVNGLLQAPEDDGAAKRPALAALPGGSANVFIRSLGLPADPVDAAGRLIQDLAAGAERVIGLGLATSGEPGPDRAGGAAGSAMWPGGLQRGRYFTFNAGLGLDAEVVRAVEGRRAHGKYVTPAMYAATGLRQYYSVTDRRHPAITITDPPGLPDREAYACFVSNSAPWTYLGERPVTTNPDASFDTGLDLMALLSLGTIATGRTLRQMLARRTDPVRGRSVLTAHDLGAVTLQAARPMAVQLDGEYMGEAEQVRFCAVPRALRVIA